MNGLVHLQPYQNQNVLKSGGYLPSSIIYRNYIVSKQDFETIKQINISSPWGSSSVKELEPHRLEFWLLIWRTRRKKNPRSKEFEEERRTMGREKPTGRRSHWKRRTNGWRMKKNKGRSRTHGRRRWTEDRLGECRNLSFKYSSSTWIYCNSRLW